MCLPAHCLHNRLVLTRMSVLPAIFSPNSLWFYAARWAVIAAIALAVYGQTFSFGFVFDDFEFIVHNPYIKSSHDAAVLWEYFPVTRMVGMYSFALNYWINQLHPAGYHIFNVVVHILATGAVWAVAALLFERYAASPRNALQRELPFIAALLFLVHPGQTQAVTYISQRFESLAALMYITAFYCYVQARAGGTPVRQCLFLSGAALAALVGILTKETVLTLPFMIIVYEWIFHPDVFRNRWRVIAACAAGVVFALIMEKVLHARFSGFIRISIPSESHDGDMITLSTYALTQMRVFLTFLRLLFFPVNQNLEYDYPVSTSLVHPPLTLVGALVICGCIAAVIALRRKQPIAAFGLAWIMVTFAINLMPRSNVIFEHKLYLLSFGFFLMAAAALRALDKQHTITAIGITAVIMLLAVLTVQRNQVWKSERVLWEDIAEKSPNKSRVLTNLGRIYGEEGKLDQALASFNRALILNPNNSTALLNRGVIRSRMNQIPEALADLNRASEIDPNYYSVYIKRAWIYYQQRDMDKALADLAQAIQLVPNAPEAPAQRAMILFEQGDMGGALADAETVLKLAPHDFFGLTVRGAIFYKQGAYEKALRDFQLAHAAQPRNPQAVKNLAECLWALGRTQEADELYRTLTGTGIHQ